MAHYTVLHIDEIRSIASQYSIAPIHSCKVLSGGSENTNYLVKTDEVQYVLTICEQKTTEKAKDLAHLLEHLASHHFSTSQVIRSIKGEAIVHWKEKPVLLKKYLYGQVIKNFSDLQLRSLGRQMGKLHQISTPAYLPQELNYGLLHFQEVENYAPKAPFHSWLLEVKAFIQKHSSPLLPKALIHSDLFYSNVIISDDGIQTTIMDFEEACHYYRVFDLGMMIVGLCSEKEIIDLEKARQLLRGYREEVQLLEIEVNSLKTFTIYAAAATAFWRHKHFNFVKPEAAMSNHYLQMKNIADHLRSLHDDCFIG